MGPLNTRFICQKIIHLVYSVSPFLLLFFNFFSRIFRLQKHESNFSKKDDKERVFIETEYKALNDVTEFREFEDEETESHLKFKFPSFDEFIKIRTRPDSNILNDSDEFTLDEPKTFQISAKINSYENEDGLSDEKLENDCKGFTGIHEKGKEIVGFEEIEEMGFTEKPKSVQAEEEFVNESELFTESDTESTSFDQTPSVMNSFFGDGFLSDSYFGESDDDENEKTESNTNLSEEEEEEESGIKEELMKLLEENFLSEKDFNEDQSNSKDAIINGEDNSEKLSLKEESMSDPGDALWEHQELIEQLKMELRKVRATGLPTILEESESPKITDDLKPWKIDEKFDHKDCIGELHKFYKSYRERMRKFDILNYQKMYAMGFLQLKDPLQSMSSQKQTPPSLKSLVSQNLFLFKHKVHGSDPMKKFIQELQGDLEVVYVGHLCLSWEFLHWQHEKALDLWDSDPRGTHRYNEVAGEFQQFQVLMQRFIEDEPFQGPRVQSYVKSRCVLRNLLQVPVIREDNLEYKKKLRTKEMEEYVISGDMLVEIVEESIRIFWRFVRADKDCSIATINGHKKVPELQNLEDVKLFAEVKKTLQKKERKLKDLLRSENCILRKFRRCREEDESDQVLHFFSQVDMKLVCRVLNMSRITREQLVWCQNKLNRIRFVNRKIHVEPAFLLFPC